MASGGQGRMQACWRSLGLAANLAIAPKELSAALTREGSAVISSGEMALSSSLLRYLLPPIPHMRPRWMLAGTPRGGTHLRLQRKRGRTGRLALEDDACRTDALHGDADAIEPVL
eukprot:CAMPEP_0169431960 /NCGR_PEP_ID=MMETSP1042-20121227/3225_1 /TAXON_ID=464988 /ORGANISM="Hemiselmis andersenii, Strain CCMP1180" /LENGTH=114 /DNA_ID=CAMNT_0009542405 /DNA_START=146 /DNA_END=488 /DNA_ORIENTATION=-